MEDQESRSIVVEVAYATPEKQKIISLTVPEGCTAYNAVIESGIVNEFPAINLDKDPMGIFSRPLNGKGQPLPKDYVLQEGDRVEIYRPLQIDPKQARLQRADKKSRN
jgi:putative ubiquitin-RnfH superfamily antitoxin RatB of RatAB toxin-antitoxin module